MVAEGATAAEGAAAAEGSAAEKLGPGVEVSVGGVGPWHTRGLKERAPLVFAIVGPEGEQLERRWVFQKLEG